MSMSSFEQDTADLGISLAKLKALATSATSAATPTATATVAGTVLQSVAVADAAGATPTQAEFNALLTALRNAGIVAAA